MVLIEYVPWREEREVYCALQGTELELMWMVLHVVLINYHCKNVPFLSCDASACPENREMFCSK